MTLPPAQTTTLDSRLRGNDKIVMANVEFRHVSKSFGANTVIPGIDLAVAITRCQSVAASPPPVIMRLMPIAVVYMSSCVVTSSGHRYWFQP